MKPITRQEIFARAARKLRESFTELENVAMHGPSKGGEAEKLIRTFLDHHIPKRFATGAGFVIDSRDQVSPQTDVIIYDAFNCPVYRASDEAAIIPNNNVAAVVEVKSRLNKDQLMDAFTKIATVKRLAKFRTTDPRKLVTDQTLGVVFAFESAITLDKISDHYREWLAGNGIAHHVDLIVVLDRGAVTLAASVPPDPHWGLLIAESLGGVSTEGTHVGVLTQLLRDNTLDAFLRILLAHLSHFRNVVDHPGFNWRAHLPDGQAQVSYLTSYTKERDPRRRKARLERYEETIRHQFAERPPPVEDEIDNPSPLDDE